MDDSYVLLKPEVPGGWGNGVVADRSTHPPRVSHLQIQIDGWLGDDLLTSFPSFFVTRRLADALRQSDFSGFTLVPMELLRSDVYDQIHRGQELPVCEWLQVSGTPGVHDFGVTARADLVVSGRALRLLRRYQLRHCESHDWAA